MLQLTYILWWQHLVKVADLAGHLAALRRNGVGIQPLLGLLLLELHQHLLAYPKNIALLRACIQQLPLGMRLLANRWKGAILKLL